MRNTSFLLFAVCLAGPWLNAQRTLSITPPGSNLLAAVAAAASGDTIVAAPGFYNVGTGLVVDGKAITIVGQPGARFYGTGNGPALTVRNVPTGRHFVLRGVEVTLGGYNYYRAFAVLDNAGEVHLAGCQFIQNCNAYSCADSFEVSRSQLVTFSDCSVRDVYVEVESSAVYMARSSFHGHGARDHPYSGRAATVGVWASGEVTMAQCSSTGGAGDGKYPGASAVVVLPRGRLTIVGDANDAYTAGVRGATASTGVSAIRNYGGTLGIDDRVKVVPNQGQAPITGAFSMSPRPVSVAVQSAAPGGVARITVISESGEPVVLFAGLPATPRDLPPFGRVAVDLQGFVILGGVTMGSTGHWILPVSLPTIAALSGVPCIAQAVAGGRQAPVRFSVPGPFVID